MDESKNLGCSLAALWRVFTTRQAGLGPAIRRHHEGSSTKTEVVDTNGSGFHWPHLVAEIL